MAFFLSVSMPINYNFLCEMQIRFIIGFPSTVSRNRMQQSCTLSTKRVRCTRIFARYARNIARSNVYLPARVGRERVWIRTDRTTAVDNSRVFTLASFALRSIALSTAAGFEFKVIVASRLVLTKPSVFIVLRSFQRARRNYISSLPTTFPATFNDSIKLANNNESFEIVHCAMCATRGIYTTKRFNTKI